MARPIAQWSEADLARFIQGAVRTQLAQLPVSMTLQNVTATQLLAASKVLSVLGVQVLMPNLPKADPHVVGQLWNNAGVLTVSSG